MSDTTTIEEFIADARMSPSLRTRIINTFAANGIFTVGDLRGFLDANAVVIDGKRHRLDRLPIVIPSFGSKTLRVLKPLIEKEQL
jgi:hypothetical protein